MIPRPLLTCTLLLAACSGEPASPARRVVLITCDTLRADHLGVYGYDRPTSPEVDALARESVVFQEAYASASMTQPAIASLLTGRYPDEVGASPGNMMLMPPEVETLAEQISAAGIPTAAVVSNGILRGHPYRDDIGPKQGFEHYDNRMEDQELNRALYERKASDTTDAAISWLETRTGSGADRFFLWVHYQDPHGPYIPPEEYARQFQRPQRSPRRVRLGAGKLGKGQIPNYQILDAKKDPKGRIVSGEDRPDVYADLYDAEIRYFDAECGRLLDWLRENDLYRDSLIVLTADHGESLGEKDYWFCHGENVQREVVRVPMLVRYPAGVDGPPSEESDGVRRCTHVVGHVDVWPTVLEALGLPVPRSRGMSLIGEGIPPERVLGQDLVHTEKSGRPAFHGLSNGRFRVVWDDENPSPRMYDIQADPQEATDLAQQDPYRVKNLQQRFRDNMKRAGSLGDLTGVAEEVDAERAEQLQALGYLDDGDLDDE